MRASTSWAGTRAPTRALALLSAKKLFLSPRRFTADRPVMEYEFDHIDDPYRRCEDHCNHDLVRGILVSDLLGSDGPYRPTSLLVTLPFDRGFRESDVPQAS